MESQGKVVKIKVGSVVEYDDGFEIVKDISFNFSKSKTVYYESGEEDTLNKHNGYIIAIDGVNVEEIRSIEV